MTRSDGAASVRRRRVRFAVSMLDTVLVVFTMLLSALVERLLGANLDRVDWDSGYLYVCAALAAVWLVSLSLADSRDSNLLLLGSDYYARVIRATFGAFGLFAVGALAGGVSSARTAVGFGFPIGIVLLVGGRWALRQRLLRQVRSATGGVLRQRVLSVVASEQAGEPAVLAVPGFDLFEAVGVVSTPDPDDIVRAAQQSDATLVFVTRGSPLTPRQIQVLGWRLDAIGVALCVEPSAAMIRPGKTLLLPHPTTTVLLVRTVHLSLRDRFIKRGADLVIALVLIPVLLPVALISAIAIAWEDGRPVLFRQARVGRGGKKFSIYKLRTMYRDADSERPTPRSPKVHDDPRCTRTGRFLRRWSIDEIPQLWCVLVGTMSLVGPRPRLESELLDSPEEFRRLEARPGISGLWQTSGRANLTFDEADLLDVEYVDNWSLIGDIVIIARTVRTVLSRRGAY